MFDLSSYRYVLLDESHSNLCRYPMDTSLKPSPDSNHADKTFLQPSQCLPKNPHIIGPRLKLTYSPTLTIDTTISTTVITITNLAHYDRHATPLLPSLNHRHRCSPPPSGPAEDKGAACPLINTRVWTSWHLAQGTSVR